MHFGRIFLNLCDKVFYYLFFLRASSNKSSVDYFRIVYVKLYSTKVFNALSEIYLEIIFGTGS
jgi:hypothetical protein